MDQLVFSTTFANQPYDLVAHQQTSTSNKNATLEQDTRPVGNSNPATPASAETTRIPESIPLLDETLARDLHFALRTARGVEIPGFGTIRVDHFEGAFTVPKPRAVPKEPKDPQTLAMAGELCDLFIGRVPYGYARDMGAMLERAVGCEVFGCSPLPNLKNPKQPATSCSLSVRLCDAWAFEALHKRCIVTEDGLLVVPPEAAEEFESILQFRDMMLQQHLGSTRKGGQALVIEKRALSQKAKPDVVKPVSEIKEYKPAAGHNIAAREFKPMQDTRGGIGANEQAPFKPSSGFRDFKLSADSREFTPHQMSTTSLQEAKPTPSKPILIAPHPICHGFYL